MNMDDRLKKLSDEIIRISGACRLILFSYKQDTGGNLSSVKLCAVIKSGDSQEMENKLYLNIDSELPFDILVYNQAEWDNLLKDEMSFASRINSLGRVLHAAD
jgi:hypothetical protein